MDSKFTQQQREKFLKDLESIALQSDSQLEDSFYERQSKRMQAQIAKIKGHQDISILEQLKRNVKEEDDMITEYEKDREQLHKITSNQTKNVIDETLISAIKEKVANYTNNSSLVLADEMYNQSVLAQQKQPEPTIPNTSFLKVKKAPDVKVQKMQEEQTRIRKKIEIANQQREHFAMEQQDKLSYKYEMHCLSELFKQRFLVPKFPRVIERDTPIKLIFSKLPPSLVRLTPQIVSEETVLPKNAPEIALKQLKQYKCKNLKPSSSIEVKVVSKSLSNEVEQFQEISQDKNNPESKNDKIDLMFKQYLQKIKPYVGKIEKVAKDYHPRFLRYLRQEEKTFNYEIEDNIKGEKDITNVASIENADNLCELKLTFEKLTNLKGIQHFKKLQEGQFQFNLLSTVDSLKSCQKLIQVNLSHNRIKNINSMNQLSWLKLLNIQNNIIQQLKPQCRSLEVLIANSNRIQEIDLSSCKQLRILELNQNRLHQLPELELVGLQQLELASNQLQDFSSTSGLILLKKLNLSHNRIQKIDSLSFLYLNELNLSSNELSTINNLFLPCIQELRLSENKLIGKGDGIAFMPNLKEINVDNNRLEGFGCVWWLLRFSKGAQIIRYGNNQYFLSLREKVREVYQAMLYKEFSALKILNDAPTDRGLAQYFLENYSIYFDGSTFFQESGPSLTKIQSIIRLLLRQSTFSRNLEEKKDPFSRQQAYIDYQWKSKVARLKRVIDLSLYNKKSLILEPTLFNKYDTHETSKRKLYHLLRGLLLSRKYRQQRRKKYYLTLKPTIAQLLDILYQQYMLSEKAKVVKKFSLLLKGLNQNQAAIKIQKVWRGYIRRKIYKKIKESKNGGKGDSDDDDVDIGFFDNEIEKVEFEIDLQDFEDIIIRPEVFEMLEAKNKETAVKKSKQIKKGSKKKEEENGPMMNNFLDSRTKLTKETKPQIKQQVQGEAERLMREWKIKDPRVLKALQYKQHKKEEMKRKQLQKNMTAAQRYQRFKRGGY